MTNYTKLANAIRVLSADSVEKSKSGHPGMPMGMADIGVTLWHDYLRHNPNNPSWPNRDRFILSNGHGSMLQYSLLHLTGYNVSITDLQSFRQLNSNTPGHPEYGYTDGVETTTGPLGQGIANGVGMALAEKLLANTYNRDKFNIIDHNTYVFLGDGCLMEGISHEVCSLAGTLGLGKLIMFYDDNGISIDGEVVGWFSENVVARFNAYNWQVIDNVDGHNVVEISAAITSAKACLDKPTIIICKTVIGKGSPNKSGKEDCHGAPLGSEEVALMRKELNWEYPPFVIPVDVYSEFEAKTKGQKLEDEWRELFFDYQVKYPELAQEFCRRNAQELPDNWDNIIMNGIKLANDKKETIATRKASQNSIEYFAQFLPELIGGSADLTGSNLTKWSNAIPLTHENNFTGNYVYYGVREFGMSAILNGLSIHGGFIPFGGTFLMFSEYARNALRMASLMHISPIFVYTHDSIGLGEDGPTHQPIEQLATLRLIPNMNVWRPCDTVETMVAWGSALSQLKTPSSLVFSRQNLNFIEREQSQLNDIAKGGYILCQNNNEDFDIVIIATGSEVEIAIGVYNKFVANGINIRVVSMPCTSIFDKQCDEYKHDVLGDTDILRVAIEAGVSDIWYKYVGLHGLVFGIDTFGESAPARDLFKHFEINAEAIFSKVYNHYTDNCLLQKIKYQNKEVK